MVPATRRLWLVGALLAGLVVLVVLGRSMIGSPRLTPSPIPTELAGYGLAGLPADLEQNPRCTGVGGGALARGAIERAGLDACVSCVIVLTLRRHRRSWRVPEPRWYTIKEVAERLRVSHDTVARMVAREELPSIRISDRIVRIPAPALQRFESGIPVLRRGVVRRRVRDGVAFGAGESVPTPATTKR
jgi:excisionase family DNA binding protein